MTSSTHVIPYETFTNPTLLVALCVCHNVVKLSNYKRHRHATQLGAMQKTRQAKKWAPAATCHRAAIDNCRAPAVLFSERRVQHVRSQHSSLYLQTSVYVTLIQTSTLQHFSLPNERAVRSVYTLHYLVTCRFTFCRSRWVLRSHFLLYATAVCYRM
jgi:hypothetical protein